MSASEFAFLALGLVLGVLSGAALIEIVRSRPANGRQVRLTVTPHSVPRRRSTTLAEDAFTSAGTEAAHGGPGDTLDAAEVERRTNVPSSLPPLPRATAARMPEAVPVHRETDWTLEALRAAAAQSAEQAMRDQRLTAAAILERPRVTATAASGETDARSASGSGATASQSKAAEPTTPEPTVAAPTVAAPTVAETASPVTPARPVLTPPPATPVPVPVDDGPCAEPRRLADERCSLATRARDQAGAAQDALRATQRAYDEHLSREDAATVAADPRAIRVAKETAQRAFRDARAAATTREEVEAAARDWLTEINRINGAAREANGTLQRLRESAGALVATIERLTLEADAARISAETAEAACLAARQAVADCQEAAAQPEGTTPPTPPASERGPGSGDDETELEAAFSARGEGEPAILRLLRGDRSTLGRLVDQLAGDDPNERRRWQLSLGGLVEAIIARSIEASALTFPLEHPFWGGFTRGQNRDIVGALSSLGYRFDGLGGWADERIPSQRDLSLAVGYAGLDPMRIRRWPGESEMAELFRDVAVAADEYLADAAGGLMLGELIDLLGRRADDLADLWNEWGRVRPALLAGA